MALKKITGKDIMQAVDWLWEHKDEGGCIHQVLGTTDDGTKLCFVVGWADGRDYGDDDKKYGYFDEGYCISAKIGYQHRDNAMQSDYEWDFNMPYDTETGDVWDTSSYVPRDADWEREASDYNKEAQKIWDTYGKPGKDGTIALDLMESKKNEEKIPFKSTEFPKELKQLYDACNKRLMNCDNELSSASDVSNKHGVSSARYTFKGEYGSYVKLKVTLDYEDGEFAVIIKGLDETEGYSWDVLGSGKSATFKSAMDAALAEFDKNIVPLVQKVKNAMKRGESLKKSESAKGSMRRKQESLAKKNEGFMEDLPYDAPVAIDALCSEIMSHTEEFTIEDAAVAEMCGKWYIRSYAGGPTAAHNEEEWVEEVTVGLSGSPVDGSPFGAAEAEEYAHRVYKEEFAE